MSDKSEAAPAVAQVPQGWPTNEMIEAGRKAAMSHGPLLGNGQSLWHIFRDMLAAAPEAPAVAQVPSNEYQRGWDDCVKEWAVFMKKLNAALNSPTQGWANRAAELHNSISDAIAAAPNAPAQEPRNVRERWNIELDGDDLLVCFNDHDKGDKCRYQRYVPAQAAQSAGEVERDTVRLNYLQSAGATVEVLPGWKDNWRFRVGGRNGAVSHSIRSAIDAALSHKEPQR